jgi:hypothetical protein
VGKATKNGRAQALTWLRLKFLKRCFQPAGYGVQQTVGFPDIYTRRRKQKQKKKLKMKMEMKMKMKMKKKKK